MSVSRTEPAARRQAAARAGGSPDPAVARRVDQLVSQLTAPSPQVREAAIHAILREAAQVPGPYDPGVELLDALRHEIGQGGRLERSPEAHLAAAHALAERGRGAQATDGLWSAIRLAETGALSDRAGDRERARFVNREAGKLFSRLGDAYQANARYEISRYYSVTKERRLRSLAVRRAEPRAGEAETSDRRVPQMGAPREPVAVPAELRRTARPPDAVPPAMEGRPGPVMQLFEIANLAGAHARLLTDASAVAEYLRRRANAAYRRDLLPPPPRPHEVRALERAVREGLAMHPGTRQRAAAETVRSCVDLYYLHDAARAFWGEP